MKLASSAASMHPRRLMTSSCLLAAAALTLGATAAQALPVIPGAAGFGMDTAAGRGGTVYRVTNLNASGAGSLKACVDGTRPRVCVFEVSGTIRLTSDLIIRNSQLTIAGQTAPSPGIMIRGAAHRASRPPTCSSSTSACAPATIPTARIRTTAIRSRSKAAPTKPVKNIVIDHCSFSWAIDEIASVWGPHDNITFTNNIFAEPLNESHPSAVRRHGLR